MRNHAITILSVVLIAILTLAGLQLVYPDVSYIDRTTGGGGDIGEGEASIPDEESPDVSSNGKTTGGGGNLIEGEDSISGEESSDNNDQSENRQKTENSNGTTINGESEPVSMSPSPT